MSDNAEREHLLGDLAIEMGLITGEQLRTALEDQAKDKTRFGFVRQMGAILVARGWLTQATLMDLLREQSIRRARRLRESAGPDGVKPQGR
jgi:hypothetical protein